MAESSSSSLISVSLSNAESVSDSFHSSSAQRPTVSFLDTLVYSSESASELKGSRGSLSSHDLMPMT